jgi:hypothetical protein
MSLVNRKYKQVLNCRENVFMRFQDKTQFTPKIWLFSGFHPLLNANILFCRFFFWISPCVWPKLRLLVLCSYFANNSIIYLVKWTPKLQVSNTFSSTYNWCVFVLICLLPCQKASDMDGCLWKLRVNTTMWNDRKIQSWCWIELKTYLESICTHIVEVLPTI